VKRWRRPPLQHPLAPAFARAVESLCTALTPSSARNYNMVVRHFLVYLGAEYPEVTRIKQLRRDPRILGWMACLRAQITLLATATCIGRLFALRTVLNELAWANKLPDLAQLLRREDIPRTPHTLPRPLTAEQDQLLEQEFLRRNDLGGNVFLLLRRTGMRIGECADLSSDCLRSTGPDQWAIHVPLGKLKTERMVPEMPSSAIWFTACASSAPSIRCLPTDGSLHVLEVKWLSLFNSAITCIRSATLSDSPRASSRINLDTHMPRRCFAPV
jgi:integrase